MLLSVEPSGVVIPTAPSIQHRLHQLGLDAGQSERRKNLLEILIRWIKSSPFPSRDDRGKGLPMKIGRNAGTGRFAPVNTAIRKPATHVVETIKPAPPKASSLNRVGCPLLV